MWNDESTSPIYCCTLPPEQIFYILSNSHFQSHNLITMKPHSIQVNRIYIASSRPSISHPFIQNIRHTFSIPATPPCSITLQISNSTLTYYYCCTPSHAAAMLFSAFLISCSTNVFSLCRQICTQHIFPSVFTGFCVLNILRFYTTTTTPNSRCRRQPNEK